MISVKEKPSTGAQTPGSNSSEITGRYCSEAMVDPQLTDWVRDRAAATPDAPVVVFGDRTTTYAELDEAADRSAAELRSNGLGRGSLMPFSAVPRPETVELLVSGSRLGATLPRLGRRRREPARMPRTTPMPSSPPRDPPAIPKA